MKSTTEKVALAVAILIIIIVISGIVGGVFLFVKLINHTKESISAEKFAFVMEYKGYEVEEVKDKFLGSYIKMQEGYVAKKDNCKIEFYTFKDLDSAKEFFSLNKSKFDTDSAKTKIDFTGKNYATFNIEANGKYKFLERVDKTVICVNVDKSYKDDVEDIVDELGY